MIKEIKDKKFIFFDVGYTLDKPASGNWLLTNKFNEIAKERIEKSSVEEIKKAIAKGIEYAAKHHLISTQEEEIDRFNHFYKIISDELELNLTNEEIIAISTDRATNMDNYIIYDDVIEVLTELKKHYKIGIISDTWPSITKQLKAICIYHFFDTYTYSFELGVFKPDKKMYYDALKKSGCKPEDTVFIDDSIENLKSAQEVGITPILIAANKASDVETTFRKIYCLKELLRD